MNIRDLGIKIGQYPAGQLNKISDVPGITVGHTTIRNSRHNTGVTVILPSADNIYHHKLISSCAVFNGFGKTQGLIQIEELGTLETPIALTNTLNVGLVHSALTSYMISNYSTKDSPILTLNPVVCECNDSRLNDIQDQTVSYKEVNDAISSAKSDFEEGSVGAGTGTVCYGFKGGIGSSSRIIAIDGKKYTIGTLVLSNHGRMPDLMIDGLKIGKYISDIVKYTATEDKGSIIMITATDIPLSSRQLKRIVKRSEVGLVRTGSFIGNGSGDIAIGFSTATQVNEKSTINSFDFISESNIEIIFRAVSETTEESILNSMLYSNSSVGYKSNMFYSLCNFSDIIKEIASVRKADENKLYQKIKDV
jgi:D-aminopeptidase